MSLPVREAGLTITAARWLTTAPGLEAVTETTRDLDTGGEVLEVGTRLRRRGLTAEQASAVTTAAQARRRAREDWPDADRLLFSTAALEQSSHPTVSAWRARRFSSAGRVVDGCSGLGGDALAIAHAGPAVVAIDHDAALLLLLRHNAAVRGLDVTPVHADVHRLPVRTDVVVHVDPSRRVRGRRVGRLRDYRPGLPALTALLGRGHPGMGIVLSPAVSWDDPDLPRHAEIELIQHGRRLVEAVAWLGSLDSGRNLRRATLLPEGLTRASGEPPAALPVSAIGRWLVEPAPAAVRARLHDQLGAEIGAWRVARRRALLTCDQDPGRSPWWSRARVEAVLPLRAGPIRAWLRTADAVPLEIACHGDVPSPDELWPRLGRPERGPSGRRLHLVRLDDGACAIATRSP